MKRVVVTAGGLFAVVLIQLTIVNGMPLPGWGVPDLVLLCVVSLGLVAGPRIGLLAGFFAGLALDLAPPASALVGQYALVLCVAGYLGGKMRFTSRQSALLAITAATVAAAVGEVLAAALSLVLDTPQVTLAAVARVLPSSVFYDAVLCPLVLFATVRIAVALGVSFSPLDDSPAMESGGSAAPAALGAAGLAGGQRARLGASRAAAGGHWLIGDAAKDAPALGAVGWLAGPARSRRARREQARLTATLTGASPRKGAFWVGTRPPGLVPVVPPPAAGRRGLSLLRLRSGVAGSAAAFDGLSWRPGQLGQTGQQTPARSSRPVRLGLAGEQRRRAKAASRRGRAFGRTAPGRPEAGLDQHGLDRHGVIGPDLRRIAFGTGGLPGSGRAAGKPVPRIAFGTGGLPGSGRAAGKPVPRIAFGTGGLPGSG
ncbi:MAG TPA: rod shape-determining protein MreD, partial [Streptosporangiaceae bacterium]